jgi:glycosyltransferase involved in cell wall biosynthesis
MATEIIINHQSSIINSLKIAIVHDYLNQYGGAERVVEALCEMFPEAPIFTSIYDPARVQHRFDDRRVITSFMQKLPGVTRKHQAFLPFYPAAFERFDFSGYDLVVSSSSAWAKGIKTGANTLHICYCHAPMRFVWQYEDYAERENINKVARRVLPSVLRYVKLWDVRSAARPNFYIANSETIRQRIQRYWQRDATVINPPVEVSRIPFSPQPRGDFYLWVGRMTPYKRADVAVKAFKELDLPLKVVGTGRDFAALQKLAGSKTEFLGYQPDEKVRELFSTCRAFIQVGAEDFGITPVEAMAGGAPVIAIKRDGPAETVLDGITGVFFDRQTPASLGDAVRRFEATRENFNPAIIRQHAERYSRERFIEQMSEFITRRYGEWKAGL